MADRYWVGGSGSWNGTAGTKWSATSGGPGGASVPTTSDDVFFNAASGTVTVTIDAGNVGARSINCTGFTGTLGGAASLTIAGGFTFVAGMGFTYGGSLTITGSGTLTSAGKTFAGGGMIINAPAGTVNLGDALSMAFNFSMQAGTFNTNNFNLTCQNVQTFLTGTRAMNLGSSTVTSTGSFFRGDTTLNAGTSQINMTGASPTFGGNGGTFHNVAFTNTTAGTVTINDNNTFNNLSFTGPSSAGVKQVAVAAGTIQTVNGTLSTTGTVGNRRVWFRSATYGISTRLVVNSAPSLTDADFRDVIVSGTAAPISGTRIGDLRGNSGIAFSAPKTVYRAGTGNWSDDRWRDSPTGTVSLDNFPLAQDTAVFDNLAQAGTHTMDSAIPYCGTVDMSTRTTALTLSIGSAQTVYGNWIFGSGITQSGTPGLTFSGRNTQTITSAGRTFSSAITVDTYGGIVTLADALNIGTSNLIVTNGTFNTSNYSLTVGSFQSSFSNIRTVILGSSTVTLSENSAFIFGTSTNLTFDAGTSTISLSSNTPTFQGGNQTFHNVSFTAAATGTRLITGSNTFNNLTLNASATGLSELTLAANQIVNGTLTCAGSSVIARGFVRSDTIGTARTLTVGTLAATNCDFRDITIAGAAAGSTPTRAGDCGGNSGITFPSPKTVYWNLAGTQNWSATAWAATSGGTPAANNFPLAQDTVVFDNAGAAGTVTIDQSWNVGSVNMSARTNAMTFNTITLILSVYGNWTFGTGVTMTLTFGGIYFMGRGTSTIICNGVSFNCQIRFDTFNGTVLFGDAFLQGDRLVQHLSGTVNAQTFNVTCGAFQTTAGGSGSVILNMGTGLWTLFGVTYASQLWTWGVGTLNKGTANILLSDNSTTARTFAGGGQAYNKLTIGGATGTSTTTITGNNSFTELASTKTVAHTIALGSTTQQFGAWTVTGTAGNVVTLTGTGISHAIVGDAPSGIDYLAMGSIGFTSSSAEFYAGANSTGTGGNPVFRTARPAPRTLYWVGGTGNWSNTARWSLASGGAGGEAIPRSFDNVIFNAASNATAYTATIDVVSRCNQLTVAGPASGNLTLAGSNPLTIYGNVSFPATGFTRTYTGAFTLSGSTTGKTFTSNGVTFASQVTVNGMGAGWSMSDALNIGTNTFLMSNGTFSTNNFNLTAGSLQTGIVNSATLNLGSSTVALSIADTFIGFTAQSGLFTFNAGTSNINVSLPSGTPSLLNNSNVTFHNMRLTPTTATTGIRFRIASTNTFNNLTFDPPLPTGLFSISMETDRPMTVNGTLTFTAPADATRRYFCSQSFTGIGTPYTISCGAFSGSDVDFRDIVITGAAAPISGTRLGNCGGNSGITFPSPKTVYWNLAAGGNWSSAGWATTSGGTPAINNFPLAQDTCIFEATGLNSGATITMNATWHIGTINMSARTTNTMTLSITNTPIVCGNWINGTGTTITNFGVTFSGRSSQTITSVGRSFPLNVSINSPGGTVTLQDAITMLSTLIIGAGTFNTGNFNVSALDLNSSGTATRALAIGTSTLTLTGATTTTLSPTGLTVTGSGTISMTSASAKTFAGGGTNLSTVILNQGGNGTLTVTGDNTFRDITATQTTTTAATINLGTSTQRLAQFTGKGESGRVLTIQGTSAASPASLVYTGSGPATPDTVDHLNVLGIRAYPLTTTWYAGNNSTNSGTLGWIFEQTPAIPPSNGNFLLLFI